MARRPPLGKNHVSWEETSRLGLGLGSVVGQLDATTNYVTDDRFDMGKWDALHRKLTVVDAYSAAGGLEELQRGRVDVIIQSFGAEELYFGSPVQASSEHPIPGVQVFEHVFKGSDVVERVEANIDEHRRFADAYDEYIEVALTEEAVRRIVDSGKIAMVLMLISGLINNDLRVLRRYHELGVRVMAPCHMGSFDWSDSTAELKKTPGLSEFGREVITECNTLGVLVDLAHASDQTCWDALDAATKPVIATHTKCRAL